MIRLPCLLRLGQYQSISLANTKTHSDTKTALETSRYKFQYVSLSSLPAGWRKQWRQEPRGDCWISLPRLFPCFQPWCQTNFTSNTWLVSQWNSQNQNYSCDQVNNLSLKQSTLSVTTWLLVLTFYSIAFVQLPLVVLWQSFTVQVSGNPPAVLRGSRKY